MDENSDQPPKRKPKSLYEPTENMLSSRRELERRKQEIRPEDDPFWEKRGGKGERLYPKYPDVTSEKPHKDHHGNVLPLPPSSRLLTPTKAAIHGTYQKENHDGITTTGKTISPLPVSSHLLTPTKASAMAEYHISTSSLSAASSSNSPPKSVKSTNSQLASSSSCSLIHSATLFEMTANRRASLWEKKSNPETDPREEGWKNILLTQKMKGFREVAPVPVAHHNELYKDVKSKLYNPTIASSHQMWIHFHEHHNEDGLNGNDELLLDDDGIERDASLLLLDEGSDHQTEEQEHHHHHLLHNGSEYQSYLSYHQARYANICSRLYDPTAATKASMWSNRMPSPPPRRLSDSSKPFSPPEVESKVTKAQLYSRREKFVRHDSKDLVEIEKKQQQRQGEEGSTKRRRSRSESAPVYGRVYVPVYTPIATRAQLVQRFPRSLSPTPRRPTFDQPPLTHITIPEQHPSLNGEEGEGEGEGAGEGEGEEPNVQEEEKLDTAN